VICVVLVSAPAGAPARELARELVERRHAACVSVIPGGHSVYRWQGKVEEAAEDLLVIKTHRSAIERLEAVTLELHPYEVPEFIVLDIDQGLPPYLQWVADQVLGESE
jgi:periplasmic divalent cation tolerance protein